MGEAEQGSGPVVARLFQRLLALVFLDAWLSLGVQLRPLIGSRGLLPAAELIQAARTGGVEISALALPQCCLSAQVAEIVREAGATQVTVASRPDENALFEALKRALPARRA